MTSFSGMLWNSCSAWSMHPHLAYISISALQMYVLRSMPCLSP
uniref:Uncharacterized protein n=1 Tax=Arundo donax TaxID=35708 RepID=A0A0A8ZFS5_ARUDO